MSLGLGIFLSTLLVSAIYLFPKIKNWRKIIKPLVFIVIAVPFLIWLCMVLYGKYENYPRKMNEYLGVKLGDKMSDVRFFKGEPERYGILINDPINESVRVYPLETFKNWAELSEQGYQVICSKNKILLKDFFKSFQNVPISKYEKYRISTIPQRKDDLSEYQSCLIWMYKEKYRGEHLIYFTKEKTVEQISCWQADSNIGCQGIFSIGLGSSYQDIINHFGIPFEEPIGLGNIRYLYYPKYNVFFYLSKNEVFRLGIENPD